MDPAKRLEKIKRSIHKLGMNESLLSDLNRFISEKIQEAKRAAPWIRKLQAESLEKNVFAQLEGKFKGRTVPTKLKNVGKKRISVYDWQAG